MIKRIVPSSLRARLLLSYTLLTLLTAVLVTGGSLALYGSRLERDARNAMVGQALTLSNILDELVEENPETVSIERLIRLVYTDSQLRRSRQSLLISDASGRPVASMFPGFQGRGPGNRSASNDRQVGQGPEPSGRGGVRPPFVERSLLLPPPELDEDGGPVVGEVEPRAGNMLLYASVPVPVPIAPSEDLDRLIAAQTEIELPLHLTILRTRAELRGLWRSMLPSVLQQAAISLLLASLVAWLLAGSITRPVVALTDASARMAGGDYSVSVAETGRRDELGKLARSFNAMALAVSEADRRQREFVANVGHDLRTPLTSVRGFAEALVDGTAKDPEQRKRAVAAIDSASHRMLGLVESLIELARLEGHAAGMTLVDCEVERLIDQVIEAHLHQAQSREVIIEQDVEPELVARMDFDWMARALGNLLDNAIRHGPEQGIVRIRAARGAGGGLVFEVSDRGPGFAQEDLPRVFERFYRADRSRRAGGSGLGLAIAREIIEAHGGSIEVDNSASEGAQIRVRLP